MRQKSFDDLDEGIWAVVLALIKPVMLVLICIFATTCFMATLELNKLSSANLTQFTELTSCSAILIPMLISIIGLYATYHMHKSTMVIFLGLLIVHGIFSVVFLIFALTNDCFEGTLTATILQMNSTMPSYSVEIFDESKPIYEWSKYEETWAIDKIQKGLSCCDKREWDKIMAEKYDLSNIYPKSCCKKPYIDGEERRIYCQSSDIFQHSCADQFRSTYSNLLVYIGVLCVLQALLIGGAQIISFKVQEPATERPTNPAEIAWMQFVNAQYKTDSKSRSKSCV